MSIIQMSDYGVSAGIIKRDPPPPVGMMQIPYIRNSRIPLVSEEYVRIHQDPLPAPEVQPPPISPPPPPEPVKPNLMAYVGPSLPKINSDEPDRLHQQPTPTETNSLRPILTYSGKALSANIIRREPPPQPSFSEMPEIPQDRRPLVSQEYVRIRQDPLPEQVQEPVSVESEETIPNQRNLMAYTGPALPTIQSDLPEIAAFSVPQPTSGIMGIPPLVTYAARTPIYLSAADAAGNATDWYQYPTQNGEILFDVSGFGQQILQASGGDLTFDGDSTLAKNFYFYPVADGNLNFTDKGNGQAYPLESLNGNLYYDGEILAKAGDIQDIAAWADYPAVSNLDMNTKKINNAGDINCVDIQCNDIISGGDITAGAEMFCSHMNIIEPGTQLGDIPATTTEIFEGIIENGSDIINHGDISTNTLHVATIATVQELNLDASGGTGPCILTTNTAGSALFVNGVEVQTGTPADVSQWATFPAVANVDVNSRSLIMNGSLLPPATNKFQLGAAVNPIGINDQYAFNTNIYNMSPVGGMNIASNSSMSITTTSTTGTNEMNISLIGAAGEDMNITGPDVNITMTDPGSFMNLTAPAGVAVLGGGGFFMASGVMEVVTGLDIRLITPGQISIGSGNVGGATTQVEKYEFLDANVSPMNGTNHLILNNIEVKNVRTDAGSEGIFTGELIIGSTSGTTNTVTSNNTSSEKTRLQVQVDQGSSIYKAMNLTSVGTGGINFNMSAATGTTMNMNYDGTTLAVSRPTSITGNMGSSSITTGQIAATGNISTPLDISGGTMHTGTLTATGNISTLLDVSSATVHTGTLTATVDVSGASGHFGPLYSSDTTIHLGSGTGVGQGANAVAIGTTAGKNGQGTESVAIGLVAGFNNQGTDAVAIGTHSGEFSQSNFGTAVGYYAGHASQGTAATALGVGAGFSGQGANSVAVGFEAGNVNLGTSSVAIGYGASSNGGSFANTIVINATGSALNPAQASSCYIDPVRQTTDAAGYQTGMMRWNATTKEVSYSQQVGSLQVVATSATAINLLPTAYGKTFILTGTTTQDFTTGSLTTNDAGWFCIVHNGNATSGGDINLTGMTGTAIVHEQKANQNGGNVYLYWTGTALVGY